MGAIASGGVTVINDDVVRGLRIPPEAIEQVAEREGRELLRREQAYREGRPFLEEASQDLASIPPVTEQTVWHVRTPRRGLFTGQGRATGRCQEALAQALPAERSRARGCGPFPG
jgi:hypothetical protein